MYSLCISVNFFSFNLSNHAVKDENLKLIQSSTSWPDVAKSLIAVAAIALEFHPYSPTSHTVIAAPAAVLYYILCSTYYCVVHSMYLHRTVDYADPLQV